MTTTAMHVAKERQLDWLLGDVPGGVQGGGRAAAERTTTAMLARPWLAAAVALFAAAAAVGVALLRAHDQRAETQEPAPEIPWRECHGAGELAALPADVTALRCFDFDDAACSQLARLPALQHLDLSGTDVNDQGYSVSLTITDAGVRALAPLTNLRWLSLATCHQMQGEGLQVLEAMPQLEHLDLTYSGVGSPALERLPRLVALRTLVLSHCMNFHGRSLAAVAKIPGLRRLELRACTTLAAKDVLCLVQLKELRHLDLRDCQGRFRGQTASGFRAPGAPEPPPPPVQDGIGITDDVVAALAALPLQTLRLGGSESLGDAIGEVLATMPSLRSLDLSNLPRTTGALLLGLPRGLTALALDGNDQLDREALRQLPALPGLRELGLSGLRNLDDETLWALQARQQWSLHVLRLGGTQPVGKAAGPAAPVRPKLSAKVVAALLATQRELRSFDAAYAAWIDRGVIEAVAALPHLADLDLTNTSDFGDGMLAPLSRNAALRRLNLTWCRRLDRDGLSALAGTRLHELVLHGTRIDAAAIRDLAAAHFRGCTITLPNGARFRAP